MTKQHLNITLSFLVVGHTKFAPDQCFGLFKRAYRRERVSCLEDIVKTVNKSSTVNVAQIVGTQDGKVIVPMYDWAAYLSLHIRKLPGIKKYHHFRFSSEHPGSIFLRINAEAPETKVDLVPRDSWSPSCDQLPDQIHPEGLSPQRQWYLYESIREFCTHETRDLVCPKPDTDKPQTTASATKSRAKNAHSEPPSTPPPTKKARLCGFCRNPGHTARSCPHKES